MESSLVKIQPGVDITVNYPTGIVPSLADAVALAVLSIGTSLVKHGIYATGAIVQAVENTRVSIKFYRDRGYYLREYVIPTVALYEAFQMGRDYVYRSGWDEDLRRGALSDLAWQFELHRVT